MEFTLFYQGALGSNKGSKQKQALRRVFHKQLAMFWDQDPLKDQRWLWDDQDNLYKSEVVDTTSELNGFRFVPLVSKFMYMVADINVQLLRPEPPGTVNSQSGDLDNRIKTLFDALRVPKIAEELPDSDRPAEGETPFFCLLEDDELIHRFSVSSHRWLEPTASTRDVILIITVKTAITRLMARNEGLGGNVI